MFEDKKPLIDLVPDSVDNAVKNITDKPTQNMGTTLADIWYLVFGGISQAAEKRKLKYSYAIQDFEKELKEKISEIPKDKLIDPDIQIVAHALETAKYCIDKEELRHMFSKLISNSLSSDYIDEIRPIYIHILSFISLLDVQLLLHLYNSDTSILYRYNADKIISSLFELLQFGLIYFDQINNKEELPLPPLYYNYFDEKVTKSSYRNLFTINKHTIIRLDIDFVNISLKNITITKLGYDFLAICT